MRVFHSYLNLLFYKAWADLRSEARRYYIAYLWWVLEPVLEMLVFYLVFAVGLRRSGHNFAQFLLVGLVVWKWFETTVKHCGTSIINSAGLIRQVAIPKIFFPSVVIITDTFKALVTFGVVFSFLLFSGLAPNKAYAALPLLFLVQVLIIMAVGYLFAAITPFFPDFMLIVSHILRLIFYLSGIFYDPRHIPEPYRSLFFVNPLALLVSYYRGVLLEGLYPDLFSLFILGLLSLLLVILVARFLCRYDTIYPRVIA